jgi:RHS repeat-associated protein
VQVQGQILGQQETGAWVYILPDHLGSVRQLVGSDSQVDLAQSFDPFGVPFETFGSGESDFGYTGEWWDSYMELYYLRARWYAPETGTFFSKDPVESEPPYLYVWGNPINSTDPSGKFPPLPDPPISRKPGVVPEGICDTWANAPQNFRDLCTLAYNGDIEAMEEIFEYIVFIDRATGRFEAANALQHYLDGTTTPGEPLYFSGQWYLSSLVTQKARDEVKRLVLEQVNTLRESCNCNTPQNKIHVEYCPPGSSFCINIDPSAVHIPFVGTVGVPDDRQLVLGAHKLNADAYLHLNAHCIGWITYEFYVREWYDFRKGDSAANTFVIPGLGWVVSNGWADMLVDSGRAAEYWAVVQWTDWDIYWNWR